MKTEEITNADRLATLKALPVPAGAQFSVKDVTNVNHKPHPYTIGPKHVEEAQNYGGALGEEVCRKIPCAEPGCSTKYENHTSDTVCLIEVSARGELKDVSGLQEFLVSIKDKATELGVAGFAFVQATKAYEPKEGERIVLVQPSGSTEPSKLTKRQYKSYGPRPVEGWGRGAAIWAHVRYDDDCGNGHNSFAITGSIRLPGRRAEVAGGCLHDEIALAFPELAPFIKWHLCSSDGPMHYIANTLYRASDRDYNGRRKGEPSRWDNAVQFGENPIKHRIKAGFAKFLEAAGVMSREHHCNCGHVWVSPVTLSESTTNLSGESYWCPKCNKRPLVNSPVFWVGGYDFEVIRHDHGGNESYRKLFGPKYTFGGYAEQWHECPFDTEAEALDFLAALKTCKPQFLKIPTGWSDGKNHEFDAARRSAAWPEATEEDLTAPNLKERLEARLPGLLIEMRRDVESLGFVW